MHLTMFSDYALRVLMYTGTSQDRLITIEETSKVYGISKAHLMKVVNVLTKEGFLRGVRGRSGGFALAKKPEKINIGDVVRATEPNFALVECFGLDNECIICDSCKLPDALNEALRSFVTTLDKYTLADIMLEESDFLSPCQMPKKQRGPDLRKKKSSQTAGFADS